jgi:uncharacterized membrane protein SpoIIM required for sporulation
MKEAAFIKQNKTRWEEFESVIRNQADAQPDKLAELFIQITDDLSFARTQYPDTRTTKYLNALASKIHLQIYKNKKEEANRFITFWKYEVPKAMAESQRPLLYAFIIFFVSGVIGTVSSFYDSTFVRLILSDQYVNTTLENIKEGNPTSIYGSSDAGLMFILITWNNIMVAFKTFVMGVFTSIGSGVFLFYNGVMVGSFISLFYLENQLGQALPVIMLHGTIELTSIVIAGAAGFSLGNGLLFPGTYSRLHSFKMGALRGMKIVMGLVPFFILAGFIESFITRYAFMHWSIKMAIIAGSTFLMIYYFILYPIKLKKNGKF